MKNRIWKPCLKRLEFAKADLRQFGQNADNLYPILQQQGYTFALNTDKRYGPDPETFDF